MDKAFEEKLKAINLPEKTIADLQKKKKVAERLKFVLDEAKVEKCEKEVGQLLLAVAEKLNPTYNHRLPVLLKYVINKEIENSNHLDICIQYLTSKDRENVDEEDFKKKCGIGLKLTEDDIRKAADESINKSIEKIKKERYKFQTVNILYDVKAKFGYVDSKLAKKNYRRRG